MAPKSAPDNQPFELVQAPDAAHSMHQADPQRFADILTGWSHTLPASASSGAGPVRLLTLRYPCPWPRLRLE
jgi:hypothetical protein